MKSINELTEREAKEILSFVYPDNKGIDFQELKFEHTVNEDGSVQITFGGRLIVGILYYNGQDNAILHFNNTKAVLWLYKNGYDITEQLELNSGLSKEMDNFENFAFAIYWMARGADGFAEDRKHKWTLDYVTRKCAELYKKYYLTDD